MTKSSRDFRQSVLLPEYQRLWDSMTIPKSIQFRLETRAKLIHANRVKYERVSALAGGSIPWWFIGILHSLESDCSFSKHLHNGDPLTGRTFRVPEGRPVLGNPPFTWSESAVDALKLKNYDRTQNWGFVYALWQFERYNGFGYRLIKNPINSPYLWGGTNHEQPGKFTKDGVFDRTAKTSQLGAAALLRALTLESVSILDLNEESEKAMTNIIRPTRKPQQYGFKEGDTHLIVNAASKTVKAFDFFGQLLWELPALADGQHPNWKANRGDTPPGLYKAGQVWNDYARFGNNPRETSDLRAYGWLTVDMIDLEGNEDKNGRAGICLHGGGSGNGWPGAWAPLQPLLPTWGCIRMHNTHLIQWVFPRLELGDVYISVFQDDK